MPSLREERLQERIEKVRPKSGQGQGACREGRVREAGMTPEEQAEYDQIMTEGRSVADAMKQYRHDQEVFAFAKELSTNVIGGGMGGSLVFVQVAATFVQGHGFPSRRKDAARRHEVSGAIRCGCGRAGVQTGPGGSRATGAEPARRDPGDGTRPARVRLGVGTFLDFLLRLAGPVLLAFAILALRARTKR